MQRVAAELEISSESSTSEAVESSDKPKWSLKKGNICGPHNLFVF